jgi:hypothetical protein
MRLLKIGAAIATLICLFIICVLFVGRPVRRTYHDYIALDGTEPWGPLFPKSLALTDLVVLYRSDRRGNVCFDFFRSKTLHDSLIPLNGKQVTVEYDTTMDFEKVRGYNVHSVNGIVLANGDVPASGIFVPGAGSTEKGECW